MFLDLCLDEDLDTEFLTVLANADEEAAATILKQPYTAIGLSDTGAHAALECCYGFSTHLLGYWVREKEIMPLSEAVAKVEPYNATCVSTGDIRTPFASDTIDLASSPT